MDYENYVSLVPLQDGEGNGARLIARNLSSLASLANLAGLTSPSAPTHHQQNFLSLEHYRMDQKIDPDSLKIKEFAETFKILKTKLKGIEDAIIDLEKKRDTIRSNYEDAYQKLVGFFELSETNPLLTALKQKTVEMVASLNLEKYYEERGSLQQQYRVAVPLLSQVKDEFFGEAKTVPSCPICYEKDIGYVAIPCGHCLCEDCRRKILSTCFQCRTPVLKLNRIYIDST